MITVPVRDVVYATPRTRVIQLDLGHEPFAFSAGQAVMVGLAGSPLRKPYSIASAPAEARHDRAIQLLLQVDELGGLDPHLELAARGTMLDVDGPFGTFGVDDAPVEPTLFVAGGTGIAPLRSMLMEWLAAAPAPALSLVYSARSPEELAYRDELMALGRRHRLAVHLTVTRDGEEWEGRRGRIDEALLRLAMPSPKARCVACGPPLFLDDIQNLLPRVGVTADRYFTQRI